jgi:type I restriction enzyme M protein
MDAAEYKHVVLGLIFLKYISDAFEEQYAKLQAERSQGADPEDPDEYRAVNVFWVPKEARWATLKAEAKQPKIGKVVDEAMLAIERDNPSLKGVLPKDYARKRRSWMRRLQRTSRSLVFETRRHERQLVKGKVAFFK